MTPAPPSRQLVAVVDGGPAPLELAARALGRGADATIYGLSADADFVVKLYHDPDGGPDRSAKLEAMLRTAPERTVTAYDGARVVELAWPEALVAEAAPDGEGRVQGFVMPAVDLDAAVLLVELLSPRGRRAAGISDSVRFRVTAAANLAASVAALHAAGHHVIDLKPANLHVYRASALIAILDCDGMSIQGPHGGRYPAHQYTDGYIAPEALRSRARPEALGEPQDRFALAVVLFELLNNGLHPFQGVPNRAATVPNTNGERIAAGLYPYGSGSHTLAPPPASPYPFLDTRTQVLFQRAFDGSPDARPSAPEWAEHLRDLLDTALAPCAEDPAHARFGDKLCATCELDPVLRKRRRRAAYAARRYADVSGDEDPNTLNRILSGALAAAALLVFLGFAIGSAFTAASKLAGFGGSELSLQTAVGSGGFAEVKDALRGSSDPDIDRTDEAPFPWRYGPGFEVAQVWNADRQLEPLPRRGVPPLHRAALDAKPYVLALLLTYDIDFDARDATSRTPLMYAATAHIDPHSMSPADAVELKQRIDRTAAVHRQRTRRAIENAYTFERDGLSLRGLAIHTIWSTANGPMYTDHSVPGTVSAEAMTLRYLIDAGADVDAQDRWGRTPLAHAAITGNGSALWQLVAAGADPNLPDQAGITPLMLVADGVVNPATDSLALELASLLLAGGADAAQADRSGRTAADFVGSRETIAFPDPPFSESATLALLEVARQPDGLTDTSWLATARPPFPARQLDADRVADIGDPLTNYGTPESDALAATLPAPPWGSTLEVACRQVPTERVPAELQLRPTWEYGIAEPGSLQAPEWVDVPDASADELAEDPGVRDARATEQRARERCLSRARLALPSRFDVRGLEALTGPIWVEIDGREGDG